MRRLLLVLVLLALTGCAGGGAEPAAIPRATATLEEDVQAVQEPTNTLAPADTPEPRATVEPTSTPESTATAEATATVKPTVPAESFDHSNLARLAADPDAYVDARVEVIGHVFQPVERDEDGTYWQMHTDPFGGDYNTLVAIRNPEFDLEEGDYVRVAGLAKGKYEAENMFGQTIELLTILAEEAEVVDALAAAPEAIKTVELNESQTQHDLTITLKRVEFAKNETRVIIEVKNATSDDAIFYDTSSRAVQGETQFDAEYHDYPDVQSTILPGVTSSGVVVFPEMDPQAPVTFLFEAHTEDYSLDFERYVYEVTP